MVTKVKFYYDPVSPWAYVALTVLKRYCLPWNLDVELCPVFLGAVMVAAKNRPPVTILNKGLYMNSIDLPLATSYYDVPFRRSRLDPDPTKNFPPQSLHISRLLTVIKAEEGQAKLAQVTDMINEAMHFKLNKKAFDPSAWSDILVPAVFSQERLDELIGLMNMPEIKEKVKEEAEGIVNRGAFGFPWWEITRDDGATCSFFGSDRFEVMAWWLGKKWNGPYPDGRKVECSIHTLNVRLPSSKL